MRDMKLSEAKLLETLSGCEQIRTGSLIVICQKYKTINCVFGNGTQAALKACEEIEAEGGFTIAKIVEDRPLIAVTTEDLKVDAIRGDDKAAQDELDCRGVNWREFNSTLYS